MNAKLDSILDALSNTKNDKVDGWLNERETKDLLGLKTTTLWQMRRDGKVTFTKVNGKTYYQQKSIDKLFENNKIEAYR